MVIVSPSISGKGSLPLLVNHPQSVLGYVPVAPDNPYKNGFPHPVAIKAMITFGSKDEIGRRVSEQLLTVFTNQRTRLVEISDAGHACYLDKPDEFHEALQSFLKSL